MIEWYTIQVAIFAVKGVKEVGNLNFKVLNKILNDFVEKPSFYSDLY